MNNQNNKNEQKDNSKGLKYIVDQNGIVHVVDSFYKGILKIKD